MTEQYPPAGHGGAPGDPGQPPQQPPPDGQYAAQPHYQYQEQPGTQSPSVSALTSKTPMELLPYVLYGLAAIVFIVSVLQLASSGGSRWVSVLFYLAVVAGCAVAGVLASRRHQLAQPAALVVSGATLFLGLSYIGLLFDVVFAIGGAGTNFADWLSFLLSVFAIGGSGLVIVQLVLKSGSAQQPLSSMLGQQTAAPYTPPPQQPPAPPHSQQHPPMPPTQQIPQVPPPQPPPPPA